MGWINRWIKEGDKIDITGSTVLALGGGCVDRIDVKKLRRGNFICAESIALAWHKFRKKYYENESNIYEAKIFSNPEISSSVGQKLEITIFHGNRIQVVMESLQTIRLSGILDNTGRIKEKIDIEQLIPGLTRSEFLRLRSEINGLLRRYKPRWEMCSEAKNIGDFLLGIKKGSKKFRNKMSGRGSPNYTAFVSTSIRPVNTLWTQLGLEIDEKLVSISFTLWKMKFLDLNFREFLFKMSQGLIHGNTVVSHFGNVDRKCTFCKVQKLVNLKRELRREPNDDEWEGALPEISDETRAHIFWDCQIVQETVAHVNRIIWGNHTIDKKTFLMGRLGNSVECTAMGQLISMYIRYKIWNYKLAGVMPKKGTIVHETECFITDICKKPNLRGQMPLLRHLYNTAV